MLAPDTLTEAYFDQPLYGLEKDAFRHLQLQEVNLNVRPDSARRPVTGRRGCPCSAARRVPAVFP